MDARESMVQHGGSREQGTACTNDYVDQQRTSWRNEYAEAELYLKNNFIQHENAFL
jgi:hypothetical protein